MTDDQEYLVTAPPGCTALVRSESTILGAYDTKNSLRPGRSYVDLDRAFDYFNSALFKGQLPSCLITIQRAQRALGYFSGDRLVNVADRSEIVDEIALNPIHFDKLGTTHVLAVLVHESVHLWQHHFGKPSRGRYHNKEWARKMVEIGLVPSDTGAAGGKATGERVGHFIREDGPFDRACKRYLTADSIVLFQDAAYRNLGAVDNPNDGHGGSEGVATLLEKAERERQRKAASKTRFMCARCGQHAWGHRGLKLLCGNDNCDQERMLP